MSTSFIMVVVKRAVACRPIDSCLKAAMVRVWTGMSLVFELCELQELDWPNTHRRRAGAILIDTFLTSPFVQRLHVTMRPLCRKHRGLIIESRLGVTAGYKEIPAQKSCAPSSALPF